MNVTNWDVTFGRKIIVTVVAPGYYGEMKHKAGRKVTTKKGVRARLERIEYQLRWKELTPLEKKQVKNKFGIDAKQKYHRFTRFTLKRSVCTQSMFPTIDWLDATSDEITLARVS